MKVFYHTDLDGECSAAIVCLYYKGSGEYIPINYGEETKFESIKDYEKVIILDWNFNLLENFLKLYERTTEITLIDHHLKSMQKEFSEIKGLRSTEKSACELTWEYFYGNSYAPDAVKLIGDFDTWKFKYIDTEKFCEGIKLHDTSPESNLWKHILNYDNKTLDIIQKGDIALKYRNNSNTKLVKNSFEIIFEGYRSIACNAAFIGPKLFDSIADKKYDIKIVFYFNGKGWVVSLYTDNDLIDVNEIAKRFGGGGHRKASGYQSKNFPFESLYNIL